MPYFELYMQEQLEQANKKKQKLEPKSSDTKQQTAKYLNRDLQNQLMEKSNSNLVTESNVRKKLDEIETNAAGQKLLQSITELRLNQSKNGNVNRAPVSETVKRTAIQIKEKGSMQSLDEHDSHLEMDSSKVSSLKMNNQRISHLSNSEMDKSTPMTKYINNQQGIYIKEQIEEPKDSKLIQADFKDPLTPTENN